MLPIAYYFLQVILCSALMMGYYWVVLRNKRFHQYNRFYLLAIVLLSWIVPLVKIKWGHAVVGNDPQVLQFLSVVADSNSQIEANLSNKGFQWNWDAFAGIIYFVVAGILLMGTVRALFRLYQLVKTHSCRSVGDVYLILTKAQGTPFSFFRYIFWNEEIDIRSEAGKQILQHELTHVHQKHSFDKLLIQVVLIAGWFNPFFWLIRKELDMIHEFIADRKAVNNGDTASLAQMLLTAAYPQQQFMLTHPFFFSPVKRRLQMLTNNRNPRFSYIRRLVVLPLLGIVVVLFAFRNKEEKVLTLSVASVVEKAVEKGKQLIAVEDMPLDRVAKRDTITIEADTVYIHGKDKADVVKIVPVNSANSADRPLIILDGKKVPYNVMSTIDPNLIKSVDVLKGNSAVSTMYGEEGKNGIVLITTKEFAKTKPLMILDGKKTDSAVLQIMDPNLIESVNVLKDESAIALYGDEAKNGVVIIKTKSNNPSYGASVTIRPHTESDKPAMFGRRDKDGNWIMPPKYNTESSKTSQTIHLSSGAKPLIILDGEKADSDILNKLDPSLIERVDVLKNESAKALYGEEGKDGVVVITTKKNASSQRIANAMEVKPGYKIFTETQTPAHFPGGEEAWQKYLQRNLNRDMIVEKGGPPGKYTAEVSFIVDKEGNLSDIHAENDPGYGTREEAVRIIEKGPKWVPAEQNGKKVIYKHKQKITWMVSSDNIDIQTDKDVRDKQKKNGQQKNENIYISQKNAIVRDEIRKTVRERLIENILEKEKANNTRTFFNINGSSCVTTGKGSSAQISGKTDIVIVNGKRMTPEELNSKFKRSDFILVAASETGETIDKYGKGVLLVSSKQLSPKEIQNLVQ